MNDILILYEFKKREMESVLLLKYELMKRGYSVKLRNIYELDRYKYLFQKSRLLVTPFLYNDLIMDRCIYSVIGKYAKICNLQWEQVYNGDQIDYVCTPKEFARHAVHICWGKNSYNRLKNHDCDKAVITGNMQMDFLKPEFRGWYLGRKALFKKYQIDTTKKTLLFISSFSYIGLKEKELEEINELVDFDAFEFEKLTIDTREIVLGWFDRLLTENPDFNIIYRPHPGEAIDQKIEDLCKKHKGFRCIAEESVKQWILTSDMILNWYSTAGVEAFFAGRDNLFLRPIRLSDDLEYEMFREACSVETYEDFKSYVEENNKLKSYYSEHPLKEKISEYYSTEEGFAYKKICDLIEKMLQTDRYDMPDKKISFLRQVNKSVMAIITYIVYQGNKRNIALAKGLMRRSTRIRNAVELYHKFKPEFITAREEMLLTKRLKKVLDRA